MNRNYECPRVDPEWANSRETHLAVATAIHALSDYRRSPEAIWEAPTNEEWHYVGSAVHEYVTHGDFPAEPDGRYSWGAETVKGPSDAPLVCPHCGEQWTVEDLEETTWQQWRCMACGSWNDNEER